MESGTIEEGKGEMSKPTETRDGRRKEVGADRRVHEDLDRPRDDDVPEWLARELFKIFV